MTLASLVADINAQVSAPFPDITASVGAGNRLQITSDVPELEFSFSNDTSGTLAALGVNTFFAGEDAATMRVNALIEENPALIAAAETDLPGDNVNVTRLLEFQQQPREDLDGESVEGYYQSIVSTLGIQAAAARDRHLSAEAIQAALRSQREAVSGVSLDEEAVKLIRYQSGYTAAARFITTVQEMIEVLLNM